MQGREKINLVYLFTKMGFSILVSDVDTVWMRNPLPYMAQYPEADVLTSSDHLVGGNFASPASVRGRLGQGDGRLHHAVKLPCSPSPLIMKMVIKQLNPRP